jgi:hypothetical protein
LAPKEIDVIPTVVLPVKDRLLNVFVPLIDTLVGFVEVILRL